MSGPPRTIEHKTCACGTVLKYIGDAWGMPMWSDPTLPVMCDIDLIDGDTDKCFACRLRARGLDAGQ